MANFGVTDDVLTTLKTWVVRLRQLTFGDNFRCFEWEGTLAAGKETTITHDLKVTPTRFLVLSGEPALIKQGSGDTDAQFFSIKNVGSTSDFTGKVLILP